MENSIGTIWHKKIAWCEILSLQIASYLSTISFLIFARLSKLRARITKYSRKISIIIFECVAHFLNYNISLYVCACVRVRARARVCVYSAFIISDTERDASCASFYKGKKRKLWEDTKRFLCSSAQHFNRREEMNFLGHEYYKLNRRLLLLVGLWPYEHSVFKYCQVILCNIIVIITIVCQVGISHYDFADVLHYLY